MSKPEVSVVIPAYNGERFISHAIDSVLAQTYRDFEITVVNDGSRDRTSSVVQRYLNLNNVRYLEQRNRGVAAARNTGIRASSGRFIAFLDHDDTWYPDKLEKQMAFASNHPEAALIHGNITLIDGDGNRINPVVPYATDASGNCFVELFLGNRIAVPTVLVSRKCLDTVGYLDESIQYADDYHLWMRIARKYVVGHVDQPLANYRKHRMQASGHVIGHNVSVLKTLKKILNEFPETWHLVGPQRVKDRLFLLTRHISRLQLEAKRPWRSRWYLLKAIGIDPRKYAMPTLKARHSVE
jgi:glycosyltransferase involved in cell wall biosynthesis